MYTQNTQNIHTKRHIMYVSNMQIIHLVHHVTCSNLTDPPPFNSHDHESLSHVRMWRRCRCRAWGQNDCAQVRIHVRQHGYVLCYMTNGTLASVRIGKLCGYKQNKTHTHAVNAASCTSPMIDYSRRHTLGHTIRIHERVKSWDEKQMPKSMTHKTYSIKSKPI